MLGSAVALSIIFSNALRGGFPLCPGIATVTLAVFVSRRFFVVAACFGTEPAVANTACYGVRPARPVPDMFRRKGVRVMKRILMIGTVALVGVMMMSDTAEARRRLF